MSTQPTALPGEALTDERIDSLHHASFEPMPRRKNSYISNHRLFARAIEREVRASVAAPPSPVQALYDELLFAVANKYPGETRHQTALRYLRRIADAGTSDQGSAAPQADGAPAP